MNQYWLCTIMTVSSHGTGSFDFEVQAPDHSAATTEAELRAQQLCFDDRTYDDTQHAELIDVQPKGL